MDGAALLVAGHGAIGGTPLDVSAVHTLGQLGEALLATGTSWQIRRLSAAAGERYGADRGTLKRYLDELAAEPVRAAIVVILGVIADVGGPALVTSSQLREYPEDATLPLSWIGERLRSAKADELVVVVSGKRPVVAPPPPATFESVATERFVARDALPPDRAAAGSTRHDALDPRTWLAALATGREDHVIAVDAPDVGAPLVDALLGGLCGEALDPATGTVTMRSLAQHLTHLVPRAQLQGSARAHTFAPAPPLGGLFDVRRSQAARPRPRTRTGDGDELLGTVLPGRFRLDGQIARGTFGTVYRARQLAVERDVAIKVLNADIDPSSEDGRLFVQEIRAVGRIDHGSVVRIHQADMTHDGRLFYAMELLDGSDLQKLCNEGLVPAARAVSLVRQLLTGLGAAHEANLVHADVKPANAMVVPRDGGERVVLVDFGLARLKAPDRPAESAGGTPAYMAPEQLNEGRVDTRSDLFSAALVLVTLLTGWRRKSAQELVPPLDGIAEEKIRAVLARALAIEPAKRYQTAHELIAALDLATSQEVAVAVAVPPVTTGAPAEPAASASSSPPSPPSPPLLASEPQPRLPFRQFAPLTERDQGRLHGREEDVATLIEHVLYRRSVVYTAPSGTGKTSLLRAALVPRLEALGMHPVYVRVRGASPAPIAAAIAPGATTIADAVARHHEQRGTKLVVLLDQLETALDERGSALLDDVLGFARWPDGADVTVVLCVREDYLARLVAPVQALEPAIPIVRLPPLTPAGARAAIVGPLNEARLAIEPALLDALLADLEHAAAAIAPEMGWGDAPAIYPPHLQLACSMLYQALGSGEATLTLAHYNQLGGFDSIVGEHLERVLDVELAGGADAIARDVFVSLVTSANQRTMRVESELISMVATQHPGGDVRGVLEILRERGLLVRVRGQAEPGWELVHDSLVPRVLAWLDSRDLARRRATELVRYHLRRSRADEPSLLGRAELRELAQHDAAIEELDAEWGERDGWTPSKLVRRSRTVLRRRRWLIGGVITSALAVATAALVDRKIENDRASAEQSLADRNMGRFELVLRAFDWDPVTRQATYLDEDDRPPLMWELHAPDRHTPYAVGNAYDERWLVRHGRTWDGEIIEAHGAKAFLRVTGRGRDGQTCPPSIIPIDVPGYSRSQHKPITIDVPTCQASRADMIEIHDGAFLYRGAGTPPVPNIKQYPDYAVVQLQWLPAFHMDRTEVPNAAFAVFARMAITGYGPPSYPRTNGVHHIADPDRPVTGITWFAARAYCRFLGKQLPTGMQWDRAMRGGVWLADGSPNPIPDRSVPWGLPAWPPRANLQDSGPHEAIAVGTLPGDRSPDGVLDLGGNVAEWTDTPIQLGTGDFRITRGGNVAETTSQNMLDYIGLDNQRYADSRWFQLGFRCVEDDAGDDRLDGER